MVESATKAPPQKSRTIAAISVIALAVSGLVVAMFPSQITSLLFAACEVLVISIIIWQACDPFAEAAQFLGERYRIPGSVRGATLDAVASSLPELFTGIFFVVIAISAIDQSTVSVAEAGAEGFGATVATCAGSAVYNMMLIPAICVLVISYSRPSHPTIEVESKVITRDGLWFLGCELVVVVFLFQPALSWWMAIVLLALYCGYILQLTADARTYRKARQSVQEVLRNHQHVDTDSIIDTLRSCGIRPSLSLIQQLRRESEQNHETEQQPVAADCFLGMFSVTLTTLKAWALIVSCTVIAAIACYWLVEVTRSTSATLGVPIFFLAVIVTAAASSVPDTFLSIGAAQRGDDDGAVSNAFGSNIFDICVCLSIPLLINAYLNQWQPVPLVIDGQPIRGLAGLRLLLCVFTLATLLMMWQNRQLTRGKAIVLIAFYAIFVTYAVLGALGRLPGV